jgi:FtsZ-binding cell division protein ZapB
MDDAPVSAEAPAPDLVERLRKAKPDEHCNDSLCAEAADTITALRAEVERLKAIEADYDDHEREMIDLEEEVVRQAATIERLRAALDLYREAVRIDATMEGPRFMGANSSALKRAWDADCAALAKEPRT